MVMPPGRAIVSPAFVGRAVAFEAFTQAYDRSGAGDGQTVLVSGEPGPSGWLGYLARQPPSATRVWPVM